MLHYTITYRGRNIGEWLSFDSEPTDDDLYNALYVKGLMPDSALREDVTFPADEYGDIKVVVHEDTDDALTLYTLTSGKE